MSYGRLFCSTTQIPWVQEQQTRTLAPSSKQKQIKSNPIYSYENYPHSQCSISQPHCFWLISLIPNYKTPLHPHTQPLYNHKLTHTYYIYIYIYIYSFITTYIYPSLSFWKENLPICMYKAFAVVIKGAALLWLNVVVRFFILTPQRKILHLLLPIKIEQNQVQRNSKNGDNND